MITSFSFVDWSCCW